MGISLESISLTSDSSDIYVSVFVDVSVFSSFTSQQGHNIFIGEENFPPGK